MFWKNDKARKKQEQILSERTKANNISINTASDGKESFALQKELYRQLDEQYERVSDDMLGFSRNGQTPSCSINRGFGPKTYSSRTDQSPTSQNSADPEKTGSASSSPAISSPPVFPRLNRGF